jgi:hypothetical protein
MTAASSAPPWRPPRSQILSGIDGLAVLESSYASCASPMPSMDRKLRHSSASLALAATNLLARRAVLSSSGSTASISAGSDFAAIPPTVGVAGEQQLQVADARHRCVGCHRCTR